MLRAVGTLVVLLVVTACGSGPSVTQASYPKSSSDEARQRKSAPKPPTCEQRISKAKAKRKPEAELAGYKAACDANCSEGCRLLGLMYAEQRGVAGDYDAAKQGFQSACELGDGDGCADLGELTLERTRNAKEAAHHYSLGCELKSGRACAKLAYLHKIGRGAELDPTKALDLYERGCRLGASLGCSGAARMLDLSPSDDEHVKALDQRALELNTRHCNAADTRHCILLGDSYLEGHGVTKDVKRALELYRRACQMGDKNGCEASKGVVSGSGERGSR
ncbi:MAG TPA: tetratricopeptide repeat protein [Polyangiaceae bacterium]